MKIYTVNFENIVKVYKPYVDVVKSMEDEKNAHIEKIEKYKAEMQAIINSSQTLILDEKMKKEKMDQFGKLQNEAGKLDSDFRAYLTRLQDETMKKVYSEISDIISDFSDRNSIDMVINNTEVIYFSPNMDITDTVIDLIKDKSLFTDELVNEKESV